MTKTDTCTADVAVGEGKANLKLYAVPDYAQQIPLLLAQNFTKHSQFLIITDACTLNHKYNKYKKKGLL